MEKITQITKYWLLKPVSENSKYHYIRCNVEGVKTISWFTGYKNSLGLVSSVGGDLSEENIKIFEEEFQNTISNV